MSVKWSLEEIDAEVALHNPVRDVPSDAVRSVEATELLSRILDIDYRAAIDSLNGVDGDVSAAPMHEIPGIRTRLTSVRDWTALRPRLSLAVAALVLLGVVGGTLAGLRGGGLGSPVTTPWQAARALPEPRSAHEGSGTWRLVDDVLTGTWQQNVYGPPPGTVSCSPDVTCYVLAGSYLSASAATPVSETLYVSTNEGATWSALPVPSGLSTTTAFECGGPKWCATGATYNGQPVLAVTRDGGHSFTIDPLPTGVGTLRTLSCPSTGVCMGLVSTSLHTQGPVDATLLVTIDGGSTFRDEPMLAGDSMIDLACASSTDCTAVGVTDVPAQGLFAPGVSAVTTDQGRTWTPGSPPIGFGVKFSELACADARHCFVAGFVPISNPQRGTAQCASTTSAPQTAALPAMSPKMAAISKMETALKAAAIAKEAAEGNYGGTCQQITQVSDIASTSDGGLTWTPDALPADVPAPDLNGLSCPTATECWAAGQEEVAQKIGRGTDMGSPVLVGTTDGGSTWSKVEFSVPATAPNAAGQSYLSIGSVTCPSVTLCLARGAAVQGARYAPVYSLVVPGH